MIEIAIVAAIGIGIGMSGRLVVAGAEVVRTALLCGRREGWDGCRITLLPLLPWRVVLLVFRLAVLRPLRVLGVRICLLLRVYIHLLLRRAPVRLLLLHLLLRLSWVYTKKGAVELGSWGPMTRLRCRDKARLSLPDQQPSNSGPWEEQ